MILRSFVLVLLVCLGVFAEANFIFEQKLTPTQSSLASEFTGRVIAARGNVFVSGTNTYNSNNGAVRVFRHDGSQWSEEALLSPTSNNFGIYVATDGTKIVVSTQETVAGYANAGSVYTYVYESSQWVLKSILYPTDDSTSTSGDLAANGRFGYAMTLADDKLYLKASNFWFQGLHTYDWNGTHWTNKRISGNSAFGNAYVKYDYTNNMLLDVGGGINGANKGGGYYTPYTNGDLVLPKTALALPSFVTSQTGNHGFGVNADISGNIITLSSTAWNLPVNGAGLVLVYEFNSGSGQYEYTASLANPDGVGSTGFANSVAILNSETILVSQHFYNNGRGRVSIYKKVEGVWQWDSALTENTDTSDYFGTKIWIDSNRIFVSAPNDDDTSTDAGAVYVYQIPPQCTTSADCTGANEYCAASTCASTACTTTSDCMGLFSSHLPLCGVSGYCKDSMSGTCTTLEDCQNKINLARARTKSIGAATKTISNLGGGDARAAVKSLNTKIYNTSSATDLTTVVTGSETAIFSPSLFTSVGNNTLVLEEIKNILCGNATAFCNVAIDNNRRMLQGGDITVSVTYDIDSSIFDTLPEGSFDDPAFIQALADAVGVGSGNVTILQSESSFTILYAVTSESSTNDPLTDENLQAIDDLVSNLDAVTQTVVTELGISQSAISSTSVDRCADRDCNGRGTCNPDTGACTCTDPNYWGLNCETLVVCENDGVNVPINNVPYCMCMYPYFGSRCQTLMDCECTAV